MTQNSISAALGVSIPSRLSNSKWARTLEPVCGERGRVDEAEIGRCERLPRWPGRCRRLAADRERGLVALRLELDFDVVGCYWVVVERPERHHMGHRALLPRNVVRVVEVAGEHDAAADANRHKGGLDACALAL